MGDKYVLDRDETGLTAREREALAVLRRIAVNGQWKASATSLSREMDPPVTRQRAATILKGLIRKGFVVPVKKAPDGTEQPTSGPAGGRPLGGGAKWMEIR